MAKIDEKEAGQSNFLCRYDPSVLSGYYHGITMGIKQGLTAMAYYVRD